MKNLPTILITAIVMVCCILSCSKDGDLINPASGDINSLKATNNGVVFTVSPSGHYDDDDADAIQTALNAAAAEGAGSTVQLTAGTFYLNKGIEVEGFDGYFKGVGKDKTIITTHDLLEFDVPVCDLQALIKFRHGNINISNLTIKISDPEPCHVDGTANALPCAIMITGNSCEDPGATDQPASSTFNNVKFVGGAGNFMGYNIVYSVVIGWDWDKPVYALNGDFKFTNCEFKTSFISILSDLTKGPFTIGGTGSSGNKFDDAFIACIVQDVNNSDASISNNHFDRIWWNAVQIWQGTEYVDISILSLSKFLVYGNDIEVYSQYPGSGFENAIWLLDFSMLSGLGKKLMDVNVSNNKIFMDNIGFAGILGESLQDAVITNNKIWGNGLAGIVGGIWDQQSSGWVLKGNNVQGVNAQVAPIWLGPGTSNCLVVGGSNKTNVLDEGTDNILTGVSKLGGNPVGPAVQEAMARKHEMMKSIRSLGKK